MQNIHCLAGLYFRVAWEILFKSVFLVVCSWESGSLQVYFHFTDLHGAVESLTQEGLL